MMSVFCFLFFFCVVVWAVPCFFFEFVSTWFVTVSGFFYDLCFSLSPVFCKLVFSFVHVFFPFFFSFEIAFLFDLIYFCDVSFFPKVIHEKMTELKTLP